MAKIRKVLIYNDEGVSEKGIKNTLRSVSHFLGIKADFITAKDIIDKGIHADLFIIGGGADLPYAKLLNGKGNQQIKHYVQQGGCYLGICAGAYYASSYVDFIGEGYEVKGERELAFFNGTAQGSLPELTNGYLYDEYSQASQALVTLDNLPYEAFHYHGGCAFISENPNVEIISRYSKNHQPAMICGQYGKGKFFLSGVHFEYNDHPSVWQFIQHLISDHKPIKHTF